MTCACGHAKEDHFRESGQCLFSTEEETWACGCDEYRPQPSDGQRASND